MLWLVGVALGSVTFTRTPEKVEVEPLPERPDVSEPKAAHEAWRKKLTRRAELAALDATLRRAAPAIDTCAASGGDAILTVDISVNVDGRSRVVPKQKGDSALLACLADRFDRAQLPLVVSLGGAVTYTVTRASGPPPDLSAAPPDLSTSGAAGAAPVKSLAFSPAADLEGGIGPFDWGGAADAERMEIIERRDGTAFYNRLADYEGRFFGATVTAVVYAFGAEGFYYARLGVAGPSATFRLRESLEARYGTPRWEPRFSAYYWRGEDVLVQFRPDPNRDSATVTILDIDRARKSGLADALPGDPASADDKDGRRLPKIFSD